MSKNSMAISTQVSDRRSFSRSSKFSIVEFLWPGLSDDPPLHHHQPAMTVEEDVGASTDNSSGSPADSGNFKIWTTEMGPSPLDRRDRIPNEKTPRHEATNKSSVPHLRPRRSWTTHERTVSTVRLPIEDSF
ncbi:hypothetical protein EVAR_61045_1 [Eumeta japonica]|uniref:Uncharacterized protein n=1 Tax=Eumeta variegata TaxID=151549 RepID=A0A4C1Z587_EUMVA|nr:hypothetical protein EVAR_61045_1 [Eumeta japonica]